jgi:chromosome segregation ATPase
MTQIEALTKTIADQFTEIQDLKKQKIDLQTANKRLVDRLEEYHKTLDKATQAIEAVVAKNTKLEADIEVLSYDRTTVALFPERISDMEQTVDLTMSVEELEELCAT